MKCEAVNYLKNGFTFKHLRRSKSTTTELQIIALIIMEFNRIWFLLIECLTTVEVPSSINSINLYMKIRKRDKKLVLTVASICISLQTECNVECD